jgi:hypothetical protein
MQSELLLGLLAAAFGVGLTGVALISCCMRSEAACAVKHGGSQGQITRDPASSHP